MELYKTVSTGNTFLQLEYNPKISIDKNSLLIKRLCSPIEGLSSDGLVVYKKSDGSIDFSIYNKDGSKAEISGNGMAGLASILFYKGLCKDSIKIKTSVGIRTVKLLKIIENNTFFLKVEIGIPDFSNLVDFPMLSPGLNEYKYKDISFHPVSVGNPHIVILVSAKPDLKTLFTLGQELSNANIFPNRTNVEFAWDIKRDSCSVFYYERGVGQTQASSTGSAAVYAVLNKLEMINSRIEIANSPEPVFISKKKSICIENFTKILYKITLP